MNSIDHQNTPDTLAKKEPKKMTSRRIFALAGVIILVLMYLVTFVAALTDSSASGRLFALSLFATIALPILIWIYTWVIKKILEQREK